MTNKNEIYGDDSANTLNGTVGRDEIRGYGGDDVLSGGAGVDFLHGGEGNDVLRGGVGGDGLVGDEGRDTLFGGSGDDILVAFGSKHPPYDDGSGNVLYGGAGDDYLIGEGGDTLDGGSGRNSFELWVSQSVDIDLRGLDHHGRVELSDGTVLDHFSTGRLYLSGEHELVTLGSAAIHVSAAEADTVIGGAGDDSLSSGLTAAELHGGSGDDSLRVGQDGLVFGDKGDDTILGGAGSTLHGGAGADHFLFGSADQFPAAESVLIKDLQQADIIDFSIGFDADTTDNYRYSEFKLTHAFHGKGGELILTYSADDDRTYVQGDVDGDKVADIVITLEGDHSDFTNFVHVRMEGYVP